MNFDDKVQKFLKISIIIEFQEQTKILLCHHCARHALYISVYIIGDRHLMCESSASEWAFMCQIG